MIWINKAKLAELEFENACLREDSTFYLQQYNYWLSKYCKSSRQNEQLAVENKVLREALFHENTEREKAEAERDALQETITTCESEVAEVYDALTNGNFSKMDTKAGYVIDSVDLIIQEKINEAVKEATEEIEKDRKVLQALSCNWFNKWYDMVVDSHKFSAEKSAEIATLNENIKDLQGEIEYLTLSKQEWMDKYYKLAELQEADNSGKVAILEKQNKLLREHLNHWIQQHIKLVEKITKEGKYEWLE